MGRRGLVWLGTLAGASMVCGVAVCGAASAQETTDWSGFYAGIFAGYGLDTDVATSTSMTPITVETNPGEFTTFGASDYKERFQAPFGGLQVGYNHQSDRFVLGVDGALALGGFSKARGQTFMINELDGADYTNNLIKGDTNFSLDWLTTFSGRVGMDFGGWLAYGKAGVAVADVSALSTSSYTLDSNTGQGPLGPMANGTYSSTGTTNVLSPGMVVGAGVEKMLSENLSLGVEYAYLHLGDITVSTPQLLGFLGGGGGTSKFSANMHSISAKLNYHF